MGAKAFFNWRGQFSNLIQNFDLVSALDPRAYVERERESEKERDREKER